jgi:hypothetical protein
MVAAFVSATSTNVLEVGYFNFVPFPGQMYMPLGTHNTRRRKLGDVKLGDGNLGTGKM